MTTLTLAGAARYSGGRLIGTSQTFTTVCTDSRTITPGALFVALRGPNFDGHAFLAAAKEAGAVGAMVDHEVPVALPQILVADVLEGLTNFARQWRYEFSVPMVAITGSNGKTTTKEMTAAILCRMGSVLVTRGNLNNHIGVPLTLLNFNHLHQFAVIEMGANHQGEIAALADIARPGIGLVTNAGAAHLEGFGGLEGVARGKGELYRALPREGTAVINADDTYADFWRSISHAKQIVTFGMDKPADFSARDVRSSADANGFRQDFELICPLGQRAVTLHLAGVHNVRNALGAAAAAHAAGADLTHIVAGLESMRSVGGRLELKPALRGAFVVDDSYNANPSSLKAGLDALKVMGGRRWLVLGDMRELGEGSNELHAEIGRYARASGVECLFAVGPASNYAVEAFGRGAQWYANVDALISALQRSIEPSVTVLIKGSRANRLERVAGALAIQASSSDASH